jgi:hypothetical protein
MRQVNDRLFDLESAVFKEGKSHAEQQNQE